MALKSLDWRAPTHELEDGGVQGQSVGTAIGPAAFRAPRPPAEHIADESTALPISACSREWAICSSAKRDFFIG